MPQRDKIRWCKRAQASSPVELSGGEADRDVVGEDRGQLHIVGATFIETPEIAIDKPADVGLYSILDPSVGCGRSLRRDHRGPDW